MDALTVLSAAISGATERLVIAARLGRVVHAARKLVPKNVAARQRHAQACSEMGHIETTSLAYQRSVLATNAATARGHSNMCDSITNWCLAVVRK
jgi:hypothetical protein